MECDFDGLMQMMELMRMFSDGSPAPDIAPEPHCATAAPMFFDRGPAKPCTGGEMPFDYQRIVAVLTALTQLKRLMRAYAEQAPGGDANEWRCRLLSAIRPVLDARKQNMIDILIKLMELNALIRVRAEEGTFG